MKLLVTDTNIFFDIISIGALPEFFSLDYEICTTEFVTREIMISDQKLLFTPFTYYWGRGMGGWVKIIFLFHLHNHQHRITVPIQGSYKVLKG